MNEHEAQELRGVLSLRVPDGEVSVTPDKDGARIVIEVNGERHQYSIGNPPSVLLAQLLTGHAD